MNATHREETLQHLHTMLAETIRVRELTAEGGQAIPALRALAEAKRSGKQSITTLLGDCLKETTAQADDASLLRLAQLIRFAQQALCPTCRSGVGKRWKEPMDV